MRFHISNGDILVFSSTSYMNLIFTVSDLGECGDGSPEFGTVLADPDPEASLNIHVPGPDPVPCHHRVHTTQEGQIN